MLTYSTGSTCHIWCWGGNIHCLWHYFSAQGEVIWVLSFDKTIIFLILRFDGCWFLCPKEQKRNKKNGRKNNDADLLTEIQMIKPENRVSLITFLQLLVAHHPSRRLTSSFVFHLKYGWFFYLLFSSFLKLDTWW